MNHNDAASNVKDDRQTLTGILLALLSALSYSSEAIAAKLLYARGLPPLTVLTWRFLLAALIFTLWAYRQNALVVKPAQRRLLALLGLFQAITVLFLFYAFMYIPAGLAVFLFYLYPTVLTVTEVLFLGIQPNKKRILALLFTLVGLLVIAGPVVNNISWPGFVCALAAAMGNAVFLLLSGRSLDELPVATVSAGTTLSAAAALIVATIVTNTPFGFTLDGSTVSLLLFLVLVPSVLALTCLLGAIARLGPSRTAIVATTEPFFTVLIGFLILREHLHLHELIGGIIIILAVLIERSGS